MGAGLTKEQASLPFGFAKETTDDVNESHQETINDFEDLSRVFQVMIPGNFDQFQQNHKEEQKLMKQKGISVINFSEWSSYYRISACSLNLIKISQNIGLLTQTTKLQLCCNELTDIPAEIGYMRNLVQLSVSKNKLKYLPDTIGLLTKLTDLKASRNQLESLPVTIKSLSRLTSLKLNKNQLKSIPGEIGQLKNLITLNLSDNPLEYLPAEVTRLKYLKHLRVENIIFPTDIPPVKLSCFPTLKELSARVILRHQIPVWEVSRPEITEFLTSAKSCTFCDGPLFDSFISRKLIMRKVDNLEFLVEHRLCVDHWKSKDERIALLFSPKPNTAPSATPSRNASSSSSPHSSPTLSRRVLTAGPTIPLSSLPKSPSLPSLPPSLIKKRTFLKSNSQLLIRSKSTMNFR